MDLKVVERKETKLDLIDLDLLEPIPKRDDEVELTQYIRPNGKKSIVYAPVGKDYVEKAKDFIFSTEILSTGVIAIYGKKVGQSDEDELTELANNFESLNTPTIALKRLIDRLNN